MYSVRVFIINLIQFAVGPRRRVLIIGGSFSGLAAGRDLGSHYLVTIIDAKEQRPGWDWRDRGRKNLNHGTWYEKTSKSGCMFSFLIKGLLQMNSEKYQTMSNNMKHFVVDQASSEIFLQIVSTLLLSVGYHAKPSYTLQAKDMLLNISQEFSSISLKKSQQAVGMHGYAMLPGVFWIHSWSLARLCEA